MAERNLLMKADGDARTGTCGKFDRLFGSNQPISAHFTAFYSSDQLQRRGSSIFQEALNTDHWRRSYG